MIFLINLKELEENLTSERVIELLAKLGNDEYIEKEDHIQFKTICHNINPEDASLKLYYYKKNKKFHCYTECGDTFNIFELFKRRYQLLGIPFDFYKDIILVIADGMMLNQEEGFNQVYKSDIEKYNKKEVEVNLTHLNPSLLNSFIFYPTKEWIQDGISIEAMRRYGIKYSIDQNKIIIPHYNDEGYLVGIRGRSLNEEDIELGKYMPVVIEGKMYSHPLGYNLYGLNLIRGNIKKMKMAIVAEGEKSVLQYDTMFGHDRNICVAACGSSLHSYQIDSLLRAGAERILIAFDNEGENYQEREKYYKKLNTLCNRYKMKCNMGFIYDFTNKLELKDSPMDRGKEIFLQLYKESVWVK